MQLLAHPFRLGPDGTVTTFTQDTDAEVAHTIELAIGTRLFERPMCWSFGTPDPVFGELAAGDIQAVIAAHGPPGVAVTTVTSTLTDGDVQQATVSWQL